MPTKRQGTEINEAKNQSDTLSFSLLLYCVTFVDVICPEAQKTSLKPAEEERKLERSYIVTRARGPPSLSAPNLSWD